MNYRIVCVVAIVATLFGSVSYNASAQTEPASTTTPAAIAPLVETSWFEKDSISGNPSVGDFVVGPGRSEVSVKPGETVVIQVMVTNRISDDRDFIIEVEDIQAAPDGIGVLSLPQGQRGPYSITDFVSFPENQISLGLGERARLPVTITVPANTPPGGYYGTVLISTVKESQSENANAPRSPVIARVGSLILLTVEGEVIRNGKTVSVDTINNDRGWYEAGPIELGILYENNGTVHVNPYGTVSIKNIVGEEVGYVTLEPWFVLPDSLRLREITWDREWLFGRYTVEAQINRGYDDIVDTVTTTFWVLPWKIVGGIFLIIFITIFSIRAFFSTFEFKRKGK